MKLSDDVKLFSDMLDTKYEDAYEFDNYAFADAENHIPQETIQGKLDYLGFNDIHEFINYFEEMNT